MRPAPRHNDALEQAAEGTEEDQQLFDLTAELLKERDQLERAMQSRPVIDMARGVLMASYGCQPHDAWEILLTVSQHTNTKLRTVADAITQAATGTPMPKHLQEQLAAAIKNWKAGHDSGSPG
ncbi:ANTAR domain-containing protein [Streptomyces pseudovenezuelae]|uniref:ANTAR domain-containing protein n=1 Tax=Streptomyces pseudovenezuelae TaxID=67350 RepID=UPI002E8137F5|nr:ANTAR domain-containing protein [Streptomyces pseudovenezuelae]WUA85842.1 ANTAR domain-containing protein [Streptomyces pseudovenezuelae]